MDAFAFMVGPPPFDSTIALYFSRNSFGSNSPSYCGKVVALNYGGHGTSSSSADNGDEGPSWCLPLVSLKLL
jgi:hypothetical protein